MAFAALFGDKLLNKDGEVDTNTALSGKKAVGIYFSAHWCPPCRGFTPKLAEFYNDGLKAAGMEIVFVSSDREDKDFKEYFASMPFLAMPYSNRDGKAALSKKFKVQGIPTFIVLDGAGNIACKDGRSKVMTDPKGADLPWAPKPFAEVIGDSFVKADGTKVGKEAIAGKHLLIYFSAHWCPPCRGFTPALCKNYSAYKEKGLPVEVIFSTGDRDEASFKSYHKEMADAGGDWLAIPYEDSARREALDSLFEVQGIPTLVVTDASGKVINGNGRGAVGEDSTGDQFPWAPPAVGNLAAPENIDESPSICVLMEPCTAEMKASIKAELEKVSKKYIAAAGDDDPKYLFFAGADSKGAVPQIRTICGLPAPGDASNSRVPMKGETSPVGIMRSLSGDLASHANMLLIDIPDNGGFYKSDAVEINEESIAAFIKQYEDKTLERQQLKHG